MRTTDVTTNVNQTREAYTAPQVEVIEMEVENSLMIVISPGVDDNADPGVIGGRTKAPQKNFFD